MSAILVVNLILWGLALVITTPRMIAAVRALFKKRSVNR